MANFDCNTCHNLEPSKMNADNGWLKSRFEYKKNFHIMPHDGFWKLHHHKSLEFDGMNFFNI